MLPDKSIRRWSRLVSLWLLVASIAAAAPASPTERAIPAGQEDLLSRMLGRDATLPGGCRFAGGGVETTVVVGQYACGADNVVIELRDTASAPPEAPRTQQFAVVVRSGSPSPELLEALLGLIRAGETELEWRPVSVWQRHLLGQLLGVRSLLACAGLIVLLTLVIQYVVAAGRVEHAAPESHRFAGRGRVTALGELWRRRQHSRDARVLALLALVAVFMVIRLSFLTRLPVYVDESVHIHWARGFLDPDLSAEFSVGRWLPIRIMAFFMLLPIEPLFAARLGSVVMGLTVLLACVLINRELFTSAEGLLAGVVYTMLPYALLYDRLALVDVYLVAFGTWALYFSILAARRAGGASILAMSACALAAILSKPTGGVFLALPILVSLFLTGRGRRIAYLGRVWPTVIGGTALLVFLVWAGYGAGLLGSQVAFEGRGQVADILLPNLEVASQWLRALLTPAVAWLTFVSGIVALIGVIAGAHIEAFLAVILAVAIVPSALVSKTWYPSYLLFTVVPTSLLLARVISLSAALVARLLGAVSTRVESAVYVLFVGVLIGATAPLDLALMVRPQDAALPLAESSRYVSGGLSGYGLPELAEFLRAEARTSVINVVRFDMVQPPKDGLDVYLSPSDAIHLHSVDPADKRAARQLAGLAATRRTLFVSNPEAEQSMGVVRSSYVGKAERVWEYLRPGGQTRLEVWEVTAE